MIEVTYTQINKVTLRQGENSSIKKWWKKMMQVCCSVQITLKQF